MLKLLKLISRHEEDIATLLLFLIGFGISVMIWLGAVILFMKLIGA